ncbi:DNA repair helicase [Cylindrobasidium torrendii FP15055 ss-10]|uniref:ATP-dependent DNA helicase CHL1 n=1 Tax=Cylindrobasidium torrendii FP15055 ss-10 TaxID=1314674 RepID=A0A0D7BKD5_9AGAR|nr:DNA repair helicase [Cylindrobasidium torrendii FP15055 ss-10]
MSLELHAPDAFPAFPYSPPYGTQIDLMRHLYESIEQKKVTIVESPTGTGKTLTLLCASLTWLADEHNRARKGKMVALGARPDDEEDWVAKQAREQLVRELDDQEQRYRERLAAARRREEELKRKLNARVVKRPRTTISQSASQTEENEDEFLPEDDVQDPEDNLSPAVKALMAKLARGSRGEEEEELTCTKIYYASRTHSQLTQLVPELQRLKFDVKVTDFEPSPPHKLGKRPALALEADSTPPQFTRTVALGSRKQLCINDSLRARSTDLDEACRTLLEEKGDKRCQFLPSLDEEDKMLEFRDAILAAPKDIEDLAKAGRMHEVCPYFGSRRAIKQAELVTLPYNLLLQPSAREALGIDLTDQIVIVDEAHNLISTLLSLLTHRLSLGILSLSFTQVCIYVTKFRNRLSHANMLQLKRLVTFLDALKKAVTAWKETAKTNKEKTQILTVIDLLALLGPKAAAINLLEVVKYLKSSKVARKIANYSDKQAEKNAIADRKGSNDVHKARRSNRGAIPPLHRVEEFLTSLTAINEDGRVCLTLVGEDEVEVKYQLLNPAPGFMDVVESARSVVLAGGTMSPITDVISQLFSGIPRERISTFSCGHIIPSSNLLGMVVTKGPSGQDLHFKADRQNNKAIIIDLGQTIANIVNIAPSGFIVFFPSYQFLNTAKEIWKGSGHLERFGKKKPVFFEPTESTSVDSVMAEYAASVRAGKGALLFAVIGAKLSEGLNFADDLARCVAVVGLPFPNLGSPELQERMKYVKRLDEKMNGTKRPGQKDAAAELFENMCMNAVNQSIGRAIRHKDDWAALILLDKRYAGGAIRGKLPGWIAKEVTVASTFGQAVQGLGAFFRARREK